MPLFSFYVYNSLSSRIFVFVILYSFYEGVLQTAQVSGLTNLGYDWSSMLFCGRKGEQLHMCQKYSAIMSNPFVLQMRKVRTGEKCLDLLGPTINQWWSQELQSLFFVFISDSYWSSTSSPSSLLPRNKKHFWTSFGQWLHVRDLKPDWIPSLSPPFAR